MMAGCAGMQPGSVDCGNNLTWGAPVKSDLIFCRETFALGYDLEAKLPVWTMYHLKGGEIRAKYSSLSAFRADAEIPSQYQAKYSDYDGSGYDRAQLAPPLLVGSTLRSAQSSSRMSNVVPQHPGLHRGAWVTLQQIIQFYAAKYGEVHVVSGISGFKNLFSMPGIYYKRFLSEGSRVRVPLNFYAAVYVPKLRAGFGFLLPNQPIAHQEIFRYSMSISELERRADVEVFPLMPEPLASRVKSSRITPRQGIRFDREERNQLRPDSPQNPFYSSHVENVSP